MGYVNSQEKVDRVKTDHGGCAIYDFRLKLVWIS